MWLMVRGTVGEGFSGSAVRDVVADRVVLLCNVLVSWRQRVHR